MPRFETLIDALEQHATDDRSLTYIEGKEIEKTITFKELHQRALGMLHHFQQQRLKPGDELIIFLRNNEKFLDAFWGAILGGIVPVPVAVGISDEHRSKLYKIFNKLQRPFIFTDEENLQRLKKFADANDLTKEYERLQEKAVLVETISDLNKPGKKHLSQADDVAFIQFSSGSTSDPKGVVLTHRNLILNVLAKGAAGGYTRNDVSLSWMPLTHDMGLIGFHINMIVCFMHHCIMDTDLFSRRPLLWLQKVSEKKATVICSPNFGYKHFLKALGDKQLPDVDLSCVRIILNGAEPISTRLCDEFLERMSSCKLKHNSMLPVYGLAEATLAVSFPKWGQDYRAVHLDRHALRTGDKVTFLDASHQDAVSFPIVGFPVPDMEIRIGDIEGNVFDEDRVGSILIKGPTVTQGYYDDPQATRAVMTPDGWLDTGDLGFITNGELVITGRKKEIIFANGQNYYPHDIENIALQCDKLELGKVVAFGVRQPDAEEDELLIFILHRGDLTDFLDIAREVTHIINEQTGLQIAHVIPIKRIPKTTSGKLQRRLLGDDYLNGEYTAVLQKLQQQDDRAHAGEDDDLSPTEQEVKAVCDAVLKDKQLHLHDNFFDVGISSLALAEIHQRLDDRHPGLIDVVDLFEYQTIAEISAFMDEKKSA